MNKITITKSRAGHYHLTVRDARGVLLLTDKFVSLQKARNAADAYRAPSDAQFLAVIGPYGK